MRFEELLDRHERASDASGGRGMSGVSKWTFRRWRDRYREEGAPGSVTSASASPRGAGDGSGAGDRRRPRRPRRPARLPARPDVGSGATCFGLFAAGPATLVAADALRRARPAWWIAAGPVTPDDLVRTDSRRP